MWRTIVFLVLIAPAFVWAASDAPISQAEAEKAFEKTAEKYQPTLQKQALEPDITSPIQVWTNEERIVTPDRNHPHFTSGKNTGGVDLSAIRLRVDLENTSLGDAVHQVVNKIGDETGPWQLRWRLKPENNEIKDESVNLIAEASFGEFIAYLSDRVKNMTGVQLFVSVFDGSRIIVISDTYY